MLEVVLLGIYAGTMALLTVYSFVQLQLAWLHRRVTRRPAEPPPSSWPLVTVQLPIFNERYVAERVLDHVAALDYPRDRLEIQVLDDSTDDTRQIVDAKLASLRRRGVSIDLWRREDRDGFKAGALRDALPHARGELVAIFDADFLPRPDFLTTTVPCFAEPRLAVVQARWGYINEQQSLLTRIQGFFLDVHFTVEQGARCGHGLFGNFNGTAGVWRRAAIDDAGGWRADTLTEDVDLSYRAQLRGWRIEYLEDYETPSELPVDLGAFRSQQFRWMKGGAENARLHLWRVLSSSLGWRTKVHACAHLLASSVFLAMLLVTLLSVPLAFVKNSFIEWDYVHVGMAFFASTLALCAVYYRSRGARVRSLRGKLGFIAMLVLFLVLMLGLALHNGVAVLRGWLGQRTAFVRTPKYGALRDAGGWAVTAYARKAPSRIVLGEAALLLYLGLGIVRAIEIQDYGFVPIQVLASGGLAWIVGQTLVDAARMRWKSRASAAVNAPGSVIGSAGSHADRSSATTCYQSDG